MSNSLAASLGGLDYQGRIFLTLAPQLRVEGSNIREVGYEHVVVKGFDDVVVYYERPQLDAHYGLVDVDFYQVKFQGRQGDGGGPRSRSGMKR